MTKSIKWQLLGTLGCHLCEQAEDILKQLQRQFAIEYSVVDIADKPEWVELYGQRIPVLVNCENQQQLDWPFAPEVLTNWLAPDEQH